MSESDDVSKAVYSIFQDIGDFQFEIDPDQDLYAELGLESNGLIRILVELEEHFEIAIDDNQLINARTLNEIISLVKLAIK